MTRLIVGLGNPGKKYEGNRHNIGQMMFEHLVFASNIKWKEKFKGEYAVFENGDEKIYFLKPMTYMNLSGESVVALASFFKVLVGDILVVHDEIDMPFGTLTFKNGGGLAGHNGLKSIASCMGSHNFLRLRLGVGRPVYGDVSSWVLSDFSSEESAFLDDYLRGAASAVEIFINNGFDKAARDYNRKKFIGDIRKD